MRNLFLFFQVGPEINGTQTMTMYFTKRSFKFILGRRPQHSKGDKKTIRTVVMTQAIVGHVFCAKGRDAVQLLAGFNNQVVLESGEAAACYLLLHPPRFGKTPLGLGDADSRNVPFIGSTSSPMFVCVAPEAEIEAMFGKIPAFLGQNNEIYCRSPKPWPSTYNGEEMAQQREKAEAENTAAGSFESNTMSEEHQDRVDMQLMSLSKRHFRHLMGVRRFYLEQADFSDPVAMWWYGAWVVEYAMEVLAVMFGESARRLCLRERLTRNLTEENLTAKCTGCGATVKVEFSGILTVDGRDHSGCIGPLANKIHNDLVNTNAVSERVEGQVLMKLVYCSKAYISVKSFC